ncbi:EAL domain-containing protein [Prodigiosinella aquatilis]|nr:EAL domain-containing protein [Prodigiosinella sp. LS101]WJV55295.1 EAL domain-containing protein [Prodigiosinella sp. LS101]WJV59656.1 EAL domain-containing protein [Pectobacteriaceae bacterium C111]
MVIINSALNNKKRYVMEPIYSRQNELFAMELLTRFDNSQNTEKYIQQMNSAEKQALFVNKLECIAEKKSYFIDNNILLSIDVDFSTVVFILQDLTTKNLLDKLPFIRLEISENFPNLNDGKHNPLLTKLHECYPLWLGDFGSGNANLYAVTQSIFDYIKLDKNFYQQIIKHEKSYILSVLIESIKKYCSGVIIEGVQHHSEYYFLEDCEIDGIQGDIYPKYTLDDINTLE